MIINKIYNEDCLDTMSNMPNNYVDLVVTSPPYNNWRNKRTQANKEDYWKRTNINYDNFSDKMTDDNYEQWQIKILNEIHRILKPTGTLAYNHKDRIFNFECISPLTWLLKSNLVYRQRITWDRGGMQSFNNVRFYRNEEDIYILGKNVKGFTWNKDQAKHMSIWKIIPERKKDHPATFPKEIPNRLIKAFTNEGDLVYDPFSGSGTTAKMAIENNRNYIGSEISEKYYKQTLENIGMAEKRLSPYKNQSLDGFQDQKK